MSARPRQWSRHHSLSQRSVQKFCIGCPEAAGFSGGLVLQQIVYPTKGLVKTVAVNWGIVLSSMRVSILARNIFPCGKLFVCERKSFNKKRLGEEIVKCRESNCCGLGACRKLFTTEARRTRRKSPFHKPWTREIKAETDSRLSCGSKDVNSIAFSVRSVSPW